MAMEPLVKFFSSKAFAVVGMSRPGSTDIKVLVKIPKSMETSF